jgi:hypothetical protein
MLGIGFNWLLRDCVRLGIYDAEVARLVAPFGWATTWRLRHLLIRRLGARLDKEPSIDKNPAAWRFVGRRVPDRDRRALVSDLDLPLQLITLQRNRSALEECLSAGGVQSAERDIYSYDPIAASLRAA